MLFVRSTFLPPANEFWGKVMFLQVFVCPRGGGVSASDSRVCLWVWGCVFQIPEVKLEKVFSWEHGLYLSTTFTSESCVIARGQMTSSYSSDSSIDQYIRMLDRKTQKVSIQIYPSFNLAKLCGLNSSIRRQVSHSSSS